ncbi:hypothetical protein [Streptomyces africanus]|uniref:hypothetical protein n=1 Tax=Streptomyces africanus TaxID=231024 RepID=UPI000A38AAAC|nr:hypothetical protein [Streptomyces africanus]
MPPRSPIRTVVLAQNLREFHAWCRETATSPRDRTVLYASGPHALRGLAHEGICIVRYGDWWDRMDRHALEDAIGWLIHHRNARLLEVAHA